jgi:Flp pilus assembly protein TadG
MVQVPSRRGRRSQPRRGIVTVEFALVAPLIITLLLGVWEVGRMVQVMQVLHNAAREGARQASTATVPLTDIKANVQTYIQNAEPGIVNVTGYDLLYANVTHPGVTDPTEATQLDRFTVTVNLPFDNVRWTMLGLLNPRVETLTVTVNWYSMRDLPVEVTTGLPVD